MRIVLASKSPRRKALLSEISNDFLTFDSNIDESLSYKLYKPSKIVEDIAYRKALKAKEVYPDDLIIAADTIVVLNYEILHKPKDAKDAKKILKLLSGKTHTVITGYTIMYKDQIIKDLELSFVTFNTLSDELIDAYIESGSPLDKAGAYGIQDNEKFPLVKSYVGSYSNIVGLPMERIKEELEKIKK